MSSKIKGRLSVAWLWSQHSEDRDRVLRANCLGAITVGELWVHLGDLVAMNKVETTERPCLSEEIEEQLPMPPPGLGVPTHTQCMHTCMHTHKRYKKQTDKTITNLNQNNKKMGKCSQGKPIFKNIHRIDLFCTRC